MDLQNLQTVLTETFAGNFVLYYRSHQAHVNIIGRNFYADHKLLQKVYEAFQDNIDTLGEKLRTVGATMPSSMLVNATMSPVPDYPCEGTSEMLINSVLEGVMIMIDQYHKLEAAADAVNYTDISNLAQDKIGELAKFKWMLQSTLMQD